LHSYQSMSVCFFNRPRKPGKTLNMKYDTLVLTYTTRQLYEV
jgi:hypothetical protein